MDMRRAGPSIDMPGPAIFPTTMDRKKFLLSLAAATTVFAQRAAETMTKAPLGGEKNRLEPNGSE